MNADADIMAAIDHVLAHGYDLDYERWNPAFFQRVFAYHRAGMTMNNAWHRALAEEFLVTEGRVRPRWLLEALAINLVEKYFDPKRKSCWVRTILQPVYDKAMLDTYAEQFEARGARNPRTRAREKLGLAADALRKRRQRARKA
jgi:hypothetical protein